MEKSAITVLSSRCLITSHSYVPIWIMIIPLHSCSRPQYCNPLHLFSSKFVVVLLISQTLFHPIMQPVLLLQALDILFTYSVDLFINKPSRFPSFLESNKFIFYSWHKTGVRVIILKSYETTGMQIKPTAWAEISWRGIIIIQIGT